MSRPCVYCKSAPRAWLSFSCAPCFRERMREVELRPGCSGFALGFAFGLGLSMLVLVATMLTGCADPVSFPEDEPAEPVACRVAPAGTMLEPMEELDYPICGACLLAGSTDTLGAEGWEPEAIDGFIACIDSGRPEQDCIDDWAPIAPVVECWTVRACGWCLVPS